VNRPVALVTGATSGIGRSYAQALAARGYDLVLVGRRLDLLQALADSARQDHAIEAEALGADLADRSHQLRVADRARGAAFVVNSAGFGGYGAFDELPAAVVEDLVAVHVMASLRTTQAALPSMVSRGSGVIVNVASGYAFSGSLPPDPLPYRATYAAAKSFLVTFTRALAGELKDSGVCVQALCAGRTATGFHPDSEAGQPAMSAEDVVTASLEALRDDEVVCRPGLADASLLEDFSAAEVAIMRGNNRPTLAARYTASREGPRPDEA
jgi:short-subunit dehydrogenase